MDRKNHCRERFLMLCRRYYLLTIITIEEEALM